MSSWLDRSLDDGRGLLGNRLLYFLMSMGISVFSGSLSLPSRSLFLSVLFLLEEILESPVLLIEEVGGRSGEFPEALVVCRVLVACVCVFGVPVNVARGKQMLSDPLLARIGLIFHEKVHVCEGLHFVP